VSDPGHNVVLKSALCSHSTTTSAGTDCILSRDVRKEGAYCEERLGGGGGAKRFVLEISKRGNGKGRVRVEKKGGGGGGC